MAILFLGPDTSPLLSWLRRREESVIQTEQRINAEFISLNCVDFIVSYGYRFKIKKETLDAVASRAVNLHISYLPWNRGADPNLWSFIEATPKGVTIHYIDEDLDTGDIIVQKRVQFTDELATLASTYQTLQDEIQDLFKLHWKSIRSGECSREPQVAKGTYHASADKQRLADLLYDGWNTPISVLEEYAFETQASAKFWEKYDSEIEQIRAWRTTSATVAAEDDDR